MEREPSPLPEKERPRKGTRRSFKQVMIQCYRLREEPARQREDEARFLRGQELKLIEETAFEDTGKNSPHPSPGEFDAMLDSELLGIIRGEVLRDPKIRYTHPVIRSRA